MLFHLGHVRLIPKDNLHVVDDVYRDFFKTLLKSSSSLKGFSRMMPKAWIDCPKPRTKESGPSRTDLGHQTSLLHPPSTSNPSAITLILQQRIRWPSFLWSCDFFFFCFLGPHLQHMEVPRLGVKSQQQLQAYATATEKPDLSCICDLHHSSWQHQILNPLSETKDQSTS